MSRTSSRWRGWRRAAIAIVALGFPSSAQAVLEDGQLWANFSVGVRALEKLDAELLVQVRSFDDMSEFERVVIGPSLTYAFTEQISVSVGYEEHIVRGLADFNEHRPWQAVNLNTPIQQVGIRHRLRLEERIIDGVDETGVRLRYRLALRSPETFAGVRIAVWNEIFLNLNSPTPLLDPVFGENRVFAGFQRAVGKSVALELGYQNVYLVLPGENGVIHTLMTGISAHFD